MKLKQLESLLGNLQQFSNPKVSLSLFPLSPSSSSPFLRSLSGLLDCHAWAQVELEQYPTGPHIASRMLYMDEFTSQLTGKVRGFGFCGFHN
ncbi:unnamed protein product [Linum trigynum]|uniref:Uncharacterized protein n=1 Tax=Linum trigynum TaxID=586398 RepID=A0AAV2CSR4_9ROSI